MVLLEKMDLLLFGAGATLLQLVMFVLWQHNVGVLAGTAWCTHISQIMENVVRHFRKCTPWLKRVCILQNKHSSPY